MKPYFWMMKFTPQKEWIERKGLLLWLAFFFTEIGAGLYLISMLFDFWKGCWVGWVLGAILGGVVHVLYLGRPERAWRAILRPGKSELSRGVIVIMLFSLGGVLQMAPSLGFFEAFSSWVFSWPFKSIMGILCILMIVHGHLTMHGFSSIPFWTSAVFPMIGLTSGIWAGSQLTLLLVVLFSEVGIQAAVEPIAVISLAAYAFFTLYLYWSSFESSAAAKASAKKALVGDLASAFYGGVVFVGFVIPVAVSVLIGLRTDFGIGLSTLIVIRALCALTGDLVFRYVILKSGKYNPLIYSNVFKG